MAGKRGGLPRGPNRHMDLSGPLLVVLRGLWSARQAGSRRRPGVCGQAPIGPVRSWCPLPPMRLDMDRPPRWRRGSRSTAPWNRLKNAGLEPLTPNRGTMPCETPVAPLGQEERGMTAAGIEMPGASC